MNKKAIKQVFGIDVAKDKFDVFVAYLFEDLSEHFQAFKSFKNNKKGFEAFAKWIMRWTQPDLEPVMVMEATGVYHQALANFLYNNGYKVAIVLSNKIHAYTRSLNINNQNDKIDAKIIARFGLERKLNLWKPPKKVYRLLKELTREYKQISRQLNMAKNQLHAAKADFNPNKTTINRINQRIKLLTAQKKQILREIKEILELEENKEVKEAVELLRTIPGIGLLTAVSILAETNEFELFNNRRQLASYAGFDIKAKQSGLSVKTKGRISKKGNRYLRAAMHFAALTAVRHSDRFKQIYERIYNRTGIKMKAYVAVQRRLLELTLAIYKSKLPYDENYETNK